MDRFSTLILSVGVYGLFINLLIACFNVKDI